MTYGLIVTNDSEITQITEQHHHVVMMASGSVTVTSDMSIGTTIVFPNYSNTIPIIMIRPGYNQGVGFAVSASNYLTTTSIKLVATTSGVVEYALFWDRAAIGAISENNSYGLNLYDENGSLIFNSERTVLNVDYIYHPTSSSVPASFTTPTPEFGRRFIMLNSFLRYYASYDWETDTSVLEVSAARLLSETSFNSAVITKQIAGLPPANLTNPVALPYSFPVFISGYLP